MTVVYVMFVFCDWEIIIYVTRGGNTSFGDLQGFIAPYTKGESGRAVLAEGAMMF